MFRNWFGIIPINFHLFSINVLRQVISGLPLFLLLLSGTQSIAMYAIRSSDKRSICQADLRHRYLDS